MNFKKLLLFSSLIFMNFILFSQDIDTLSDFSQDIDTLSDFSQDIDTLSDFSQDIDTLSDFSQDIDTLSKKSLISNNQKDIISINKAPKEPTAKEPTVKDNVVINSNENLSIKDYILILLIALLFFLGFITLFLLRWRLKHNKNISLISFPELLFTRISSFEKKLSSLDENFKKQVSYYNKLISFIKSSQDSNSKKYDDIIETFSKLNNSINDKENEIKQLRKGYLSKETISVLRKMIRVYNTTLHINEDTSLIEETRKEASIILNDIQEKLLESEVILYDIKPGTSIEDTSVFGIPDSAEWTFIPTEDPKKHNTIHSTLEKGFYFNGDQKTILKYIKIKVYKLNK